MKFKHKWLVLVIFGAFVCTICLRYLNYTSKFLDEKSKKNYLNKGNEKNHINKNSASHYTINLSNFKLASEEIKNAAIAKEQNCSLWKLPERFQATYDPLIKLDGGLYLYPGLASGPNNQIKGFYHSIYLAIRLNR